MKSSLSRYRKTIQILKQKKKLSYLIIVYGQKYRSLILMNIWWVMCLPFSHLTSSYYYCEQSKSIVYQFICISFDIYEKDE